MIAQPFGGQLIRRLDGGQTALLGILGEVCTHPRGIHVSSRPATRAPAG